MPSSSLLEVEFGIEVEMGLRLRLRLGLRLGLIKFMLTKAAENTFSVRWVGRWVVGLIGLKANLNSSCS